MEMIEVHIQHLLDGKPRKSPQLADPDHSDADYTLEDQAEELGE